MFKTQKKSGLLQKETGFFILLFFITSLLFLILSPKISSLILPIKRQILLEDFVNYTKTHGKIDSKKYWEFREFYSPGYFNFSRNGLNQALIDKAKQYINVDYNTKAAFPFLVYTSLNLKSIDILTSEKKLPGIIDKNKLSINKVMFQNDNSIIYKTSLGNVVIIFLTGEEEMKKTNGFFDYQEKDKDLVKNKNWLNITSIKLD